MSPHENSIADLWHDPGRCRTIIGALALVLAAISAASTWVYFTYPLEVECMEGSNWIEALAFREGRNPYRDPGLAFIGMNHGPLDAPVKALLSRALPWLEPWEVIRLPGLLLPVLLVLALRRGTDKAPPLPWPWAAAAGLGAYFVIQSTGNMVVNMGRSDALMLAFLVLLLPIGASIFSAENRVCAPWAVLAGAIGAAAFLENFRTAVVLPAFALALAFDWPDNRFRPPAALLLACGAALTGALAMFALVLGSVFRFDLGTYCRYTFGFFLAPQGHGLSGQARWRDVVDPFLDNHVWLLLLLALLLSVARRPRSPATWVRTAVLGMPFVSFLIAYASNFLGAAGGLHYFAPVVILGLLLWRLAGWSEARDAAAVTLVVGLALFACNWRIVANNTALLWHTRHQAVAFNRLVRDLDARLPTEAQDIHLFETHLHPTEVDMGFLGYLTHQAKSAIYYPKFTQSFAAHEERMRREPPAAIVVGDFPSDELAARIRAGHYVLAYESPPRIYNAENLTRTRVYLRRDVAPEYPVLTNPAPQYRAW